MARKDEMWIGCCGCGKSIHVPETTVLVQSTPFAIVWKSICPYCGFEHKVIVSK